MTITLEQFLQRWQLRAPKSMLLPLLRTTEGHTTRNSTVTFGQLLLIALFDLSWTKTVSEDRGVLYSALTSLQDDIISAGEQLCRELSVSGNQKLTAWSFRVVGGTCFAVCPADRLVTRYWDGVKFEYVAAADIPVPVETRSWNLTCLAAVLYNQLQEYVESSHETCTAETAGR